jgi:hypothetical protein
MEHSKLADITDCKKITKEDECKGIYEKLIWNPGT